MNLLKELESGIYMALEGEKIVCRGGLAKVVSYIAKQRAVGREIQAGTEGGSVETKNRRLLHIENCIEFEPVGLRLQKIDDNPGIYLGGLFETESAALEYRANVLGDAAGSEFRIVESNWRGARL